MTVLPRDGIVSLSSSFRLMSRRALRDWAEAVAVAIIILAGLALLMALGPPASACDGDEEVTRVHVMVTPADLSDRDGVRRLLRRIETAARKACGDDPSEAAAMRAVVTASACYGQAVRSTVVRIGDPGLTALLSETPLYAAP